VVKYYIVKNSLKTFFIFFQMLYCLSVFGLDNNDDRFCFCHKDLSCDGYKFNEKKVYIWFGKSDVPSDYWESNSSFVKYKFVNSLNINNNENEISRIKSEIDKNIKEISFRFMNVTNSDQLMFVRRIMNHFDYKNQDLSYNQIINLELWPLEYQPSQDMKASLERERHQAREWNQRSAQAQLEQAGDEWWCEEEEDSDES